jgi:molybdopterin-containing oxidoreductase family iron-sulfur binding subunit
MSYRLVIDMKKCVGCGACASICKAENGTPPKNYRCRVMRGESGKYPTVKRYSLPVQCMHCENPPCVKVCPTGATERNSDGIVTVDKNVCIGCRACMAACPYEARNFRASLEGYFGEALTPFEKVKYGDHPRGVVDKCDFCLKERLSKGLKPACVENCIANARFFGAKEEMAEMVHRRNGYQLRPELGTNPSIYYLP